MMVRRRTGARLRSQNRRPSRLMSGKTKRVVRVAATSRLARVLRRVIHPCHMIAENARGPVRMLAT